MERKRSVCHPVSFTDRLMLVMIKSQWPRSPFHQPTRFSDCLYLWLVTKVNFWKLFDLHVLVLVSRKGCESPYVMLMIFWEWRTGGHLLLFLLPSCFCPFILSPSLTVFLSQSMSALCVRGLAQSSCRIRPVCVSLTTGLGGPMWAKQLPSCPETDLPG